MKPISTFEVVNLDWLVLLISPNIWNESKPYKARWLAMIFLYMISCVFWYSFIPLGLFIFFGKPINIYPQYLYVFIGGSVIGLASWWDFNKTIKKKKLEDSSNNS